MTVAPFVCSLRYTELGAELGAEGGKAVAKDAQSEHVSRKHRARKTFLPPPPKKNTLEKGWIRIQNGSHPRAVVLAVGVNEAGGTPASPRVPDGRIDLVANVQLAHPLARDPRFCRGVGLDIGPGKKRLPWAHSPETFARNFERTAPNATVGVSTPTPCRFQCIVFAHHFALLLGRIVCLGVDVNYGLQDVRVVI